MTPSSAALSADAQLLLERHLQAVDAVLTANGASTAERATILEDIESHVLELLSQRFPEKAGAEQMQAILTELDAPEEYAESSPTPKAQAAAPAKVHRFVIVAFSVATLAILAPFFDFGLHGESDVYLFWGVSEFVILFLSVLALGDIRREPQKYRDHRIALLNILMLPIFVTIVFAIVMAPEFSAQFVPPRQEKEAQELKALEQQSIVLKLKLDSDKEELPDERVQEIKQKIAELEPRLEELRNRPKAKQSSEALRTLIEGSLFVVAALVWLGIYVGLERLCRPQQLAATEITKT